MTFRRNGPRKSLFNIFIDEGIEETFEDIFDLHSNIYDEVHLRYLLYSQLAQIRYDFRVTAQSVAVALSEKIKKTKQMRPVGVMVNRCETRHNRLLSYRHETSKCGVNDEIVN